jgi:hypothetical protein
MERPEAGGTDENQNFVTFVCFCFDLFEDFQQKITKKTKSSQARNCWRLGAWRVWRSAPGPFKKNLRFLLFDLV